jgi:hypothetical protein
MIINSVPRESGHTLHVRYIEEPRKEYFVGFDSLPYFNLLHFEGERRWARVLAETQGRSDEGGQVSPL